MKNLQRKSKNLADYVVELQSGSRPRGGVRDILSGVPSIGGEHLNSFGGFDLTSVRYVSEDFANLMTKGKILPNDILIVKDGATTGKVSFIDNYFPFDNATINEHVFILRVNKDIIPKFLFWYLWSQKGQSEILNNFQGSAQGGINRSFLEGVKVPVFSINEQKEKLSKIDRIIPQTWQNKSKLEQTKLSLKRFRQSILSAAITGKLTEDWREKNPQTPTTTIIEDLKRSRLSEVKTVINKKQVYGAYKYEEENNNNDLPKEWQYVSLGKLCSSFTYGTSAKSNPTGKVPVLRMGNLQSGEIDWDNLAYTSDEKEIKKYKLNTGNVLFNRTNSPELVGKASIYRGEQEAIYAGYLIKINNYSILNSEYLNYCLNSQYAREFCYQQKTDGVSQSNINAQKLSKFEVPFCSPEEQDEIVRLVKQYFDVANQVEKQIEKAEVRISKLTIAILSKTFRD